MDIYELLGWLGQKAFIILCLGILIWLTVFAWRNL